MDSRIISTYSLKLFDKLKPGNSPSSAKRPNPRKVVNLKRSEPNDYTFPSIHSSPPRHTITVRGPLSSPDFRKSGPDRSPRTFLPGRQEARVTDRRTVMLTGVEAAARATHACAVNTGTLNLAGGVAGCCALRCCHFLYTRRGARKYCACALQHT